METIPYPITFAMAFDRGFPSGVLHGLSEWVRDIQDWAEAHFGEPIALSWQLGVELGRAFSRVRLASSSGSHARAPLRAACTGADLAELGAQLELEPIDSNRALARRAGAGRSRQPSPRLIVGFGLALPGDPAPTSEPEVIAAAVAAESLIQAAGEYADDAEAEGTAET